MEQCESDTQAASHDKNIEGKKIVRLKILRAPIPTSYKPHQSYRLSHAR